MTKYVDQFSTTVTFTFGVVKINFWARLCNLQGKDWLYFLELSFPILSSGNSGIKYFKYEIWNLNSKWFSVPKWYSWWGSACFFEMTVQDGRLLEPWASATLHYGMICCWFYPIYLNNFIIFALFLQFSASLKQRLIKFCHIKMILIK